MPYVATLDANVLHPQIAVDLLLRLAERALFRPVWSGQILDELRDSLEQRGIDPVLVEHRVAAMEREFPEAMAEGVEAYMPAVPIEVDLDDRHVVAAALAGRADAIVTQNLDDFPSEPLAVLGIEVQDLDEFLLNQWTLDQETVEQTLAEMEEDRDRPPRTASELLTALEQHAPQFVMLAREAIEP